MTREKDNYTHTSAGEGMRLKCKKIYTQQKKEAFVLHVHTPMNARHWPSQCSFACRSLSTLSVWSRSSQYSRQLLKGGTKLRLRFCKKQQYTSENHILQNCYYFIGKLISVTQLASAWMLVHDHSQALTILEIKCQLHEFYFSFGSIHNNLIN